MRRSNLFLLAALVLLLLSCKHNRREEIALPYAKKKCDKPADSLAHPNLQPLSLFLWLQDSAYSEETQRWVKEECAASQAYMQSLRSGYGRLNRELNLDHRMIPVYDTVPLHLYFMPRRFGNGLNALALVLYDSQVYDYAIPPTEFFEQGGILAVLGDTGRKHLETAHLLRSLNTLVEQGYTTPRRTAMLASGLNAACGERLLLQRPELFRAVYLAPASDSASLADLWEIFEPKSTYPAVLMEIEPSRYALMAWWQELNGRRCGSSPALMYPAAEDYASLWRFLLFNIF